MAEKFLKNKKTSGISLRGLDLRVDGIRIPGVKGIEFRQDAESVPRTVIELDGEFDYEGLSDIELAIHPASLVEALRIISLWSKFHEDFPEKIGELAAEITGAEFNKHDRHKAGRDIISGLLEEYT